MTSRQLRHEKSHVVTRHVLRLSLSGTDCARACLRSPLAFPRAAAIVASRDQPGPDRLRCRMEADMPPQLHSRPAAGPREDRIDYARQVIRAEADALQSVADRLGDAF